MHAQFQSFLNNVKKISPNKSTSKPSVQCPNCSTNLLIELNTFDGIPKYPEVRCSNCRQVVSTYSPKLPNHSSYSPSSPNPKSRTKTFKILESSCLCCSATIRWDQVPSIFYQCHSCGTYNTRFKPHAEPIRQIIRQVDSLVNSEPFFIPTICPNEQNAAASLDMDMYEDEDPYASALEIVHNASCQHKCLSQHCSILEYVLIALFTVYVGLVPVPRATQRPQEAIRDPGFPLSSVKRLQLAKVALTVIQHQFEFIQKSRIHTPRHFRIHFSQILQSQDNIQKMNLLQKLSNTLKNVYSHPIVLANSFLFSDFLFNIRNLHLQLDPSLDSCTSPWVTKAPSQKQHPSSTPFKPAFMTVVDISEHCQLDIPSIRELYCLLFPHSKTSQLQLASVLFEHIYNETSTTFPFRPENFQFSQKYSSIICPKFIGHIRKILCSAIVQALIKPLPYFGPYSILHIIPILLIPELYLPEWHPVVRRLVGFISQLTPSAKATLINWLSHLESDDLMAILVVFRSFVSDELCKWLEEQSKSNKKIHLKSKWSVRAGMYVLTLIWIANQRRSSTIVSEWKESHPLHTKYLLRDDSDRRFLVEHIQNPPTPTSIPENQCPLTLLFCPPNPEYVPRIPAINQWTANGECFDDSLAIKPIEFQIPIFSDIFHAHPDLFQTEFIEWQRYFSPESAISNCSMQSCDPVHPNEMFLPKPHFSYVFNNPCLSTPKLILLRNRFNLFHFPFLIPLKIRSSLFTSITISQMESTAKQIYSSCPSKISSLFSPFLVRRDHILEDSLKCIHNSDPIRLRRRMKVKFIGEDAVDAGGVKREFFSEIAKQVFTTQSRLFNYFPDTHVFWFNPAAISSADLQAFEDFGTIIGLAVYNGVPIDLPFPKVFYKKLCNSSLSYTWCLRNSKSPYCRQFMGSTEVGCPLYISKEHSSHSTSPFPSQATEASSCNKSTDEKPCPIKRFYQQFFNSSRPNVHKLVSHSSDNIIVPPLHYSLEDLEELRPQVVQSLREILSSTDNVHNLYGLDMTVTTNYNGVPTVHHLKPNGPKIPVTTYNRQEYVDLYCQFFLENHISQQWEAFLKGFISICGGAVLTVFSPTELQTLICGVPFCNFMILQPNTRYSRGLTSDSPVVKWFWQVVSEFTPKQQRDLFRFITGSTAMPVGGVESIQLEITRADHGVYPSCSTCAFQLRLPDYPSKQLLKQNLTFALENSSGFGLK